MYRKINCIIFIILLKFCKPAFTSAMISFISLLKVVLKSNSQCSKHLGVVILTYVMILEPLYVEIRCLAKKEV